MGILGSLRRRVLNDNKGTLFLFSVLQEYLIHIDTINGAVLPFSVRVARSHFSQPHVNLHSGYRLDNISPNRYGVSVRPGIQINLNRASSHPLAVPSRLTRCGKKGWLRNSHRLRGTYTSPGCRL